MRRTALGIAQAQVLLGCTLAGDRPAAIARRTGAGELAVLDSNRVAAVLIRLNTRSLVRELEPGVWALELGPGVDAALDQAYGLVWGQGHGAD